MKDFREFLLRGNLVEMAVAFVIGLAFAAVIAAFVADLVTPLLAAIGGNPDFATLKFRVNGSQFLYGAFLNALIAFILVAAVLFFFVIKPVNRLMRARATEPDVDSMTKPCPRCLSQIPIGATKCAFCTADI